MTDRLKGLTVTFDRDIREDDAEAIINAIKMIKGVIDVAPVITEHEDYMNRTVIHHEVRTKLFKFIQEELKP